MGFGVFTDASCDLTPRELLDYGVVAVPIGFSIGPLSYPTEDGLALDADEFYMYQKQHDFPTKTSGVNIGQIMDALEPTLRNGLDVLYLGIDKDLSSGSWNAMMKARDLLQMAYPERRVEMPNTHSIAPGLGLLLDRTVKFCQDGKVTLDDALAFVDDLSKRIVHTFTVSELMTLKKGGRVGAIPAAVGTLFNVMPFMELPYSGILKVTEKIRGDKGMRRRFVRQIVSNIEAPDGQIWLAYGGSEQRANIDELADMILTELERVQISIHRIGPVIGAHTGPTVIAAFYVARSHRWELAI